MVAFIGSAANAMSATPGEPLAPVK